MISIGNFFFKYRNLLFPVFASTIFIPSPVIFTEGIFGPYYYLFPLVLGIIIALSGQVILAATIGLKYIKRGGKDKKVYADTLVTQGIFEHCRNPLYVGNIMMLTGVGLISNSLIFMVIVVPVFCFIYQAIVLAEENFLRSKFGGDYDLYCKRVNRWIPNVTGLSKTFGSMEFEWKRYLRKEYNTVYLLFLSIGIVLFTFVPPVVDLEKDEKIRYGLVYFFFFSIIYLLVKYLTKRKKSA
ncbi:MAG: isoprenylcysteine carboxylmethyltransferase family protein [Cyclobacteriaceae bacterium]|nr:isoprenylcysteine carboxylmethyltransferase family protein [Cyclobacteriaceae bacterium]